MNLGRVYLNRGQSEKAIATTESAVTIFREAKDRSGEGLALNNLGIVYSRLGQSEKALEIIIASVPCTGSASRISLTPRSVFNNSLSNVRCSHRGLIRRASPTHFAFRQR